MDFITLFNIQKMIHEQFKGVSKNFLEHDNKKARDLDIYYYLNLLSEEVNEVKQELSLRKPHKNLQLVDRTDLSKVKKELIDVIQYALSILSGLAVDQKEFIELYEINFFKNFNYFLSKECILSLTSEFLEDSEFKYRILLDKYENKYHLFLKFKDNGKDSLIFKSKEEIIDKLDDFNKFNLFEEEFSLNKNLFRKLLSDRKLLIIEEIKKQISDPNTLNGGEIFNNEKYLGPEDFISYISYDFLNGNLNNVFVEKVLTSKHI